ncbi:Allantoinase [Candidatus Anstonella stagnisolia]|nr:Allantoinase [Candidatus Anstonella stagnisolia]
MIIKNGKLVLAGGILEADLLLEGTKISGIGKFDAKERGEEKIDAKGMLVFAGFVDAHVHLRDPEDIRKEDFSTGTAAALAGGFTSVIDMPNYRNPATTTAAALAQKREIAKKKARCNYSFHFGASENNFEEVRKANPASLKIFLSDTKSGLWVKSNQSLRRHLTEFAHEKPVLVHAEDAGTIEIEKERGIGASLAGIKRAGDIAARIGRKVHFCHLSSEQEVACARRFGNSITCEVTPHHLFLNEKDAQKNPLAGMNPPLRSITQMKGLWKMLDNVDIIASDHAPHTLEDKKNGAAGVPGLETAVSLMLDAAAKKKVSYLRIAQLMCEKPCGIFGMQERGKLEKGYCADVTVVDPKEEWVVDASSLYTKCGWSPFEGSKLKGKVKCTIVNGKIAYEDGEVLALEGSGREVERGY